MLTRCSRSTCWHGPIPESRTETLDFSIADNVIPSIATKAKGRTDPRRAATEESYLNVGSNVWRVG